MDLLNNQHVFEITNILLNVNERVEGNLVCDIYPSNWVINRNLDKIKNLRYLCKNKTRICEIGINACHSLLIMLLENPDAEYLLFDLNNHRYTEPCLEYLRKQFPNTKITAIFGNSANTMKDYINNNKDILKTFDFCHIDGCHFEDVFSKDFYNIKKLSKNDAHILFDDYDYIDIKRFIQEKALSNEIKEIIDDNLTKTDLHFFYQYTYNNYNDYIDKIFLINLDKRKDRLEDFMREYKRLNLDLSKLERFSAIYRPDNPCIGCTLSHLEVIKISKERGYKNVIIFEDDFDFLVDYDTFNNRLLEFFSFNIDFKVVMLAYSCVDNPVKLNHLISTTNDSSNAAGYLVNSSVYDELIFWLSYGSEMLEKTGEHWNYINDQIWKKIQGDKWFIFNDRLGKQRDSYSDLSREFKVIP